ncbi:hypothetical protein [Acetobacter orleanensis]|uniref:Uncharacterized protein n=1 Tax=Acetobacter orleanensis TaxID=104099 RepID=A0A4Y3TM78_9PROT|nr:hypothetical protein [Acetobacter orleanensis]KXV63531.1 hypothetical protein AD949_06965 [Acetobacter orleanensis]PCD79906.1 hypothetical protein CO710_03310 [Acetobacter orleanensis]GAN68209.1 hypothetical protein Abol_015_048 [Acetobacter orleanensis JCM 7639]GBR31400.1 hypothetical protein AA0473_2529 [Acetobacter orleanensis NRIC 0473]GEB82898.1 hypothetical protein AOR01nite_13750 [Acetobacter orleanensis]
MQLDPRDLSSFPIVRILLVATGCALLAYCIQYYLVLPPDSPEHVMRHMAALIVGTLILLGTIWV